MVDCDTHVRDNFALMLEYAKPDGEITLLSVQSAQNEGEDTLDVQKLFAASEDNCVLADGLSPSVNASETGSGVEVAATVSPPAGPVTITIEFTAGGQSQTRTITAQSTTTETASFNLSPGTYTVCANVVDAVPP